MIFLSIFEHLFFGGGAVASGLALGKSVYSWVGLLNNKKMGQGF
jgi:hypothetical protein